MASIKTTMRVEGLKELHEALQELPIATGGNVLKRAILPPAQAFADRASELAPRDKGGLKREIYVGRPKIITAGKAAFAQAMSEGGTRAEAGAAARAANAAAGGAGRHAVVQVGPSHRRFYGLFSEFGASHMPPHPFMRPAWDELSPQMPGMIGEALAEEIGKAAARIAKRTARLAAKMKA